MIRCLIVALALLFLGPAVEAQTIFGGSACASNCTFSGSLAVSGANNTAALQITGGSTTGSSTTAPGISVIGTLNTTGVVTGAVLNGSITDTAAGSGSTLFNLSVGASNVFNVDTSGTIRTPTGISLDGTVASSVISTGIYSGSYNGADGNRIVITSNGAHIAEFFWSAPAMTVPSTFSLGFSSNATSGSSYLSSPDTVLNRLGAAGHLGLSDSTSGAIFKVFSTVDTPTSPTNYADLYIDTETSATTATIGVEKGGTGTSITAISFAGAGVTIGAPTGGGEGASTINVAGLYYANGTAGVSSCSGAPSSSFAVVNGIVTHC